MEGIGNVHGNILYKAKEWNEYNFGVNKVEKEWIQVAWE